MGRIDTSLPFALSDTVTIGLTIIGTFAVSIWANWFSAVVAVPMICLLFYLRQYYLKTAREVKEIMLT